MGTEIYNTIISYGVLIIGIEILIMIITIFFIVRLKKQTIKEREEMKRHQEEAKEQEFMKKLSNPREKV